MSWQILITIAIFFNSFATLIQRVLLKSHKADTSTYSMLFQIIASILIAIFGFAFGEMDDLPIMDLIPNLILVALLYGAGSIFMFKSLAKTEASEFTILFALRAVFTVIASALILGEALDYLGILGFVSILLGVFTVTYKSFRPKLTKGQIYALFASVLFGLAVTNDVYVFRNFEVDVFAYLSLAFFLPVIPIALSTPKVIKEIKLFLEPTLMFKMLIFSIFYSIQAITYFSAIDKSENSSIVVAVNQLTNILTVVLAVIILKEKDLLLRKILGVILSVGGLIVLNL